MSSRNRWAACLCALFCLLPSGCRAEKAEAETDAPAAAETEPVQERAAAMDDAAGQEPPRQEEADKSEGLRQLLEQCIGYASQTGGQWSACVQALDEDVSASAGSGPMQSASLIKLFVAAAAEENMELLLSQQEYDGETAALLGSMLSASDNEATNTLVRRLGSGDAASGMETVNAYCREHGYSDTAMGRLMLDFDAEQDNFTSAEDCCAILRAAAKNEITGAEEILDALRRQERTHKLPAGVPPGVRTANKTGELDTVENDAAIIWADSGAYVICVMSGGLDATGTACEQITAISEQIYGYLCADQPEEIVP